jgi:hypothetical protein
MTVGELAPFGFAEVSGPVQLSWVKMPAAAFGRIGLIEDREDAEGLGERIEDASEHVHFAARHVTSPAVSCFAMPMVPLSRPIGCRLIVASDKS